MCYPKPAPRCSYHAINDYYLAKKRYESAKTDKAKKAAATRLLESEEILDSTSKGQALLAKRIGDANNIEERKILRERMVIGAKLRGQAATAAQRNMGPDADVTELEPCVIIQSIDDSGDVIYVLKDDEEIVNSVPANESGLKVMKQASWERNQTIPYIYPDYAADGLYSTIDKPPTWQLAENINTARIHAMLPNKFKATRAGANDSTVSDIAIWSPTNQLLGYAEVKVEKAQAGQIVVSKNSNNDFIPTATTDTNPWSEAVVAIANKQTHLTENSNGEVLRHSELSEEDKKVITSWFKHHYIEKNAAFIAVTDNDLSYTSVFPLDKVDEYANITIAMPRAKKSGSARLPKKLLKDAATHAEKTYSATRSYQEGGKTYVAVNGEATGNLYFGNQGEYFLARRKTGTNDVGGLETIYEVRKLATTQNMTLMFNFEYKGVRKTQGKKALNSWAKTRSRESSLA
jgi:hypothetical protein